MASLLATASGNWTTASTWKVVDATSFLDSEAATTQISTSYVTSSTFTPGAITIDGIAMKFSTYTGSQSGTITVALDQGGGVVTGTDVTINAADISQPGTSIPVGWYFFKFGSPVTLLGATAYSVKIKSSASQTLNIFRNATAGNWSRMLRTTTTQAPVAADICNICGEATAAGATTALTVTMDETANTDYGGLTINADGTLIYGTTASTNYVLRQSGLVTVYKDGTLNIGTTGTPMPSTSTAVLEFDCTSDGEFGLVVNSGTFVAQGNPLTYVWALLNADAAANATSLTTDVSTGWASGDAIAVASTSTDPTKGEHGTLNGAASGTTLTVNGFGGTGGGVLNAHTGTGAVKAEVVNLTRNVKIRSTSSTLVGYVQINASSTYNLDYVELYYLGEAASTKSALYLNASGNVDYCSFHDIEDTGMYHASNSLTYGNTYNVFYLCNSVNSTSYYPVFVQATATSTFSYNVVIKCYQGIWFNVARYGAVVNYNRVGGCSTAFDKGGFQHINTLNLGSFNYNIAHSCSDHGCNFDTSSDAFITMTGCEFNRNGGSGLYTSGTTTFLWLTSTNCKSIGNVSYGHYFSSIGIDARISGYTANGEASYAQANGIYAFSAGKILLLSPVMGTGTSHTGSDIYIGAKACEINVINGNLASTNEVTNSTGKQLSVIRSHKNDQSATTHKNWYKYGTVNSDQTTRHTASGYSWKLTPNDAVYKLILPGPAKWDTFKAGVLANTQVTVTAYVQKDGSYNGTAPRLVLVGGIVAGITSDVTASLTVASGNWEQLTVSATPTEDGVIEAYIDCDGTAGSVYVDDMTITQP